MNRIVFIGIIRVLFLWHIVWIHATSSEEACASTPQLDESKELDVLHLVSLLYSGEVMVIVERM